MKKFVAMTALAVLFAAGTASAQILGGGLGGALGGTLGGGLGGTIGAPIERTTGTIESASSGHGSVSGEKAVDARRGHAKASGSANGSIASTINGTLGPVATGSTNETSGSASGGGEANFMGTDAVLATGVVGNASGAGSAAGSLSGSFLGSAGQLAAAGSAAAQGSGTFDVVSGMDVTDVKGRVIGEVVSVVSNARGVVQSVVVEAGDRTATIPAANFAGSGNVLVSGMSKGEIKSASRDQEAQ